MLRCRAVRRERGRDADFVAIGGDREDEADRIKHSTASLLADSDYWRV